MRTRFLCTDYFNSTPISARDFLRLPLSPLLTDPNTSKFEDLNFSDGVSTLSIDVEIEKFPIEAALSSFFADVLPHNIDIELSEFADPQPFASCSSEVQTSETTNSEGTIVSYSKGKENLEMVQLEIRVLDTSWLPLLEDIPYFGKENMSIPSHSDGEDKLDMPGLEVWLPDSPEILQSICSVDDISSVALLEKSADLMEDGAFCQGQYHSSTSVFPHLEVDEAGLVIVSDKSVKEKVASIENIELHCETPGSEGMGRSNELLGSIKFDTMQYLSDGSFAMGCCEVEVPCLNFSAEMDLISIIELEKNLVIHESIENDGLIWVASPIIFDELQFFDSDLFSFHEFQSEAKVDIDKDTCDLMLREAENFRNFDELLVSHELIPVDNSFRSLPVPPVPENGNIKSLYLCIKEILAELELQSPSMSDGLYLDWPFLEEEKCEYREDCFNLLRDIDANDIAFCLNFSDNEMLVSDYFFSSDSPQEPNRAESKEMLSIPSNGNPISPIPYNIEVSTKLLNDGKFPTEGVSSQCIARKASSFGDSRSKFNDLDFFLNRKEYSRGKDYKPADSSIDTSATDQISFLSSSATTLLQPQWNIKVHQILLSTDILLLIDYLKKIFLAIFERQRELVEIQDPSQAVDDDAILRLPKKKLINLIKKRGMCRSSLFQDGEKTMSLVTLSAIKQMVWYLCYYDLHSTYLYIEKLSRSLQGLESKLDFIYNIVKDVHQKGENDIHKFHPSLSVIKDILETFKSKDNSKILIVAEPVFWWSLKKLLTSMNIAFFQQQNGQKDDFYKLEDASMQMIHESDCCLVTHEHLFASFPFEKFEIILEYGGSQESSKVSSILPKSDRVPPLHFLKVELEDPSVAKALCDGVDMSNINEASVEGGPHFCSTLNEMDVTFEELLNYLPVEKNLKGGSMEALLGNEACSTAAEDAVFSSKSKQNCRSIDGCPETIVIVNTHNFDTEMVISRRSTYQKILAFEKKGVQVIERDLRQPVDIIVSASACLAWYDCKNIAKKATASDEAFSCLPQCVENLAANILTSLSFAFSGCTLVFEGESDFIAGIMESSDELYAAAASLGMDIRIFYSYSSEMTDEIILSCIELSLRTSRGLFPKMHETQTLAESFLSAFPSINPLSAHAILSSAGLLVEFLEWTHERRIHAVQKYQVPDESITLLSALSRFGEREDSKSGMTDCSSSVSSAPGSESLHFKSNSVGTKRKTTWNTENLNMPTNELFDFDPPLTFSKDRPNHPRASGLCDSRISEDIDFFDEFGNSSLSFDTELCVQRQSLDTYGTEDLFKVTELCDYQMRKDPQMGNELNKLEAPQCLRPRERVYVRMMNKLDRKNNYSGNFKEDITDEVIDIDDTPATRKAFRNAKYKSFSTLEHAMERSKTGVPKAAKKLFFGASGLQEFPTTVDIDSSPDACTSVRNHGQGSGQGMGQHLNAGFYHKKSQIKHKKGVTEEGVSEKVNCLSDLTVQDNNTACYGETPLSSARQSTRLQQGSPWTIEFLNKMREKSRSRQQFLPRDLSAPWHGYPGKSSEVTNRKSPSTIEFYKYQGNSCQEAGTRRKRPMKCIQLPASTTEKASDRFIPTWTPIDKRAKRVLSFATNGNGGQTNLVWSDKNSHTLGRRY
nr:PREDICTED: uncharacterized protein LOC107781840 isoform X1 [Nicotiana tabacum]